MNLDEASFGAITRAIKNVAIESCRGRMVSALEGGYNIDALAASVEMHLQALLE